MTIDTGRGILTCQGCGDPLRDHPIEPCASFGVPILTTPTAQPRNKRFDDKPTGICRVCGIETDRGHDCSPRCNNRWQTMTAAERASHEPGEWKDKRLREDAKPRRTITSLSAARAAMPEAGADYFPDRTRNRLRLGGKAVRPSLIVRLLELGEWETDGRTIRPMRDHGCAKCGETNLPTIGHQPCPGPKEDA